MDYEIRPTSRDELFLRGYNAMIEKLNPETIITFGSPFPEMKGNIIAVDYRESRKVVR